MIFPAAAAVSPPPDPPPVGSRAADDAPLSFADSLIALRADDIAPPAKRSPAQVLRALLRPLIFLLALAVFLIAATDVTVDLVTYRLADRRYRALAENFTLSNDEQGEQSGGSGQQPLTYSPAEGEIPAFTQMLSGEFHFEEPTADSDGVELYRARLTSLRERYPDIFGWMVVDGTNVDYPVVQGADNDYYLKHDYAGGYTSAGSVYVDYRCERAMLRNPNLVIYGHNIRTQGTMFNQLLRYTDRAFFNEHPFVKLYTPEGLYRYEVIAFFQTTSDAGYANIYFYGDEDFVSYARRMRSLSWWQREGVTDETLTPDTRLLTLSTCTNGTSNERYAVIARLVEVIE